MDLWDLVGRLQGRVERQTLILRAMFLLLRDTLGVSEEELLRRLYEIAPPGGVYGKAPIIPRKPCPKCGSSLGQRRNQCLFCGAEWRVTSAFEFLEMGSDVDPEPPPSRPTDASSDQIRPPRWPDR